MNTKESLPKNTEENLPKNTQFRNSRLHVSKAIRQFLHWSYLCARAPHSYFKLAKLLQHWTQLFCKGWRVEICSLLVISTGEKPITWLFMPLGWKGFAWTHKRHWHFARNSTARYASQHEGLCHFPTWPSFCKHRVKGHRSPPALEAQACTESLSPPGLDTNAGTRCIYRLFSTCSVAFLTLMAIKTSSLSSYKNLLFRCRESCYPEALISLLNIHMTYNQLQLKLKVV